MHGFGHVSNSVSGTAANRSQTPIKQSSHLEHLIANPHLWIGLLATIGFIGLISLVIVLPQIWTTKSELRASSLLIAAASLGILRLLHMTIFRDVQSDHDNLTQPLIIDINKVERLG